MSVFQGLNDILIRLLEPTTISVILTLFLFFQWYKQHAKEQSIKYNLLGVRRILIETSNTAAAIEALDATLASLGARGPLTRILHKTQDTILEKLKRETNQPVEERIQRERNSKQKDKK